MEFEGLGKHCSVDLCKQKDFLPFKCDACAHVYCLEHRSYATHACPNAENRDQRAIVCPLCAQTIHFSGIANENVYAVFEQHQRTSCNPEKRAERKVINRCAAAGCKEKLLLSNKTTCPKCHQDVCLRHRHEGDHSCLGIPPGRDSFLSSLTRTLMGQGQGQSQGQGQARAVAGAAAQGRGASHGRQQPVHKQQPPKPQDLLRETAHRRQQASTGTSTGVTRSTSSSSSTTAASGPQQREACPHCALSFQDPVALVEHVEQAHSSHNGSSSSSSSHGRARGDDPTPCPQCGAVFTSLPDLIAHVEGHGPGQGRGREDSSTCVML